MLRIATRGSPLARWQARHVASLLEAGDPDEVVELVVVETSADRRLDVPLWEIGGKGMFVKEVQAAVLDGRADLAVHSAKDLPSLTHPGLVLAAVPLRGDARDALVGAPIEALRPGARVGTGSARRRAQLADHRPDLTFVGLRGNMGSRVARAADLDAVVVAAVALERLGLGAELTQVLEPVLMLPQVGQGALAVECRAGDDTICARLAPIEDNDSRRCVDAERAFLAELGGDCDLPAGALARPLPPPHRRDGLELQGLLASLDGHVVLRHVAQGTDPPALGQAVARHLLDRAGGRSLLLR